MYELTCRFAYIEQKNTTTNNVLIFNHIRTHTRIDDENLMIVGRYNNTLFININDVSNFSNIDDIITKING